MTRHRPRRRGRSTPPGRSWRPASSISTATGGLVILADGRTSRRSARASRPRSSGSTGTGSRRSRARRISRPSSNLDAGLDGRPDIDYDWTSVASYPRPLRRDGQPQHRTLVGNSQLRIGVLGWDDVPADERALDRMRGDAPRGDGRRRVRAQLRARLPARELRHDRRAGGAHRGPAGTVASTTPTSAIRSATATWTRSARRSRSAGGPPHRPTLPTSTAAGRIRAARTLLALVDDARAEGLDVTFDTYPSEWARDAFAHPACPSGSRPAAPAAEGAACRPGTANGSAPTSWRAARRTPAGPAGRTSGLGAFHRTENLRWEGRTVDGRHGRDGSRTRSTSCATCLLAEDLWHRPGHRAGPSAATPAPCSSRTRSGWSARTATFLGDQAEPPDVRQLPAHPRPVRPRRKPCSASRRRSAR